MKKKLSYEALERRVKELEQQVFRHSSDYQARKYLSIARVLFVALDKEGNITLINEYGLEILGYQREELVGKNWVKTCVPERFQKEVLTVYHQLMAGAIEPIEYYENTVLRKNGTKRIIAWHNAIFKNSNGDIVGSLSSGNDITEQKQTEQALVESEEKYRILFEKSKDAILIIENEKFVDCNQSAVDMLGYKNKTEFLKTHPSELSPDNQPDGENSFVKAKRMLDLALKNGSHLFEWDHTRANGEVFPVEVLLTTISNQEGNRKIHTIWRDITHRRKEEKARQKEKETLSTILESTPHGIALIGSHGKYRYVNPFFTKITGYTLEDIATKEDWFKKAYPDKKYRKKVSEVWTNDNNHSYRGKHREFKIRCKDGQSKYIEFRSTFLKDRKISVLTDVTQRRKIEEALRESEERLRTLMETIVDPVLVYDVKGKVSYLNPAFTRVFGWSSDELVGHRIDFVPDKENSVAKKVVAEVLKGKGLSGFETERKTRSGRTIAVRIGAARLLDIHDKPDGIVVNFQDITREKRAQDELNQMNQELEKAIEQANMMAQRAEIANAAKSEFLANMSHEIRTPLNGVLGMAGLLLDTVLTNDQRHYANIVQNSGESLLTVVNDILDFSKIEAGKLEMEVIDFDLRSLLDDFASMMSFRIQKKNLEFICAASPDMPALIRGDPGRLRQILTNLVGNAVKFTAKGEISVRSYLEKETPKEVKLLFSVKDTGIGIPEEKQDLLFQSFRQADASTTRKFGGTGLGLTISKKLCEMMGGKIGINSEVDKGSEFWFTACFKKQEEPEHPVMPVHIPDMKGCHILVVDDNETNRDILQGQLGSWGCRVKDAVDGSDALRKFYQADIEKDPFQVAILDMQMPGMDGLSLGKVIKADDNLKSVHLIMMTSMGQVGDAKLFEKAGFAAYLMKPVGHSELFDCLSTIISGDSKPLQESAIITRHTVREMQRKNIRILLAEDNITNQQVATGLLKKFGFIGVKTVLNGVHAVKALEDSFYNLVLMDVQMPEMDGFEATRQIRKKEFESGKKRIPIIAMTAHAMKKDRDKCISVGMDDYVSKPVDAKLFLEAIERWLPMEKAASDPLASEPGNTLNPETNGGINLRVFDKDALMERVMGDTKLAETVILSFLDDIPRQMGALIKFIDQKNTGDAGKQGHLIKGAAGNVGADTLRKIAYDIETAGKVGDLDMLILLVPQLEEAFDQLKVIMEEMIR
ncbi:PAS domain-containing hybrid sensor histidine kinase/response regulator [Desulfobacula sp.]|uniref:PAS domain-containing hybrid sensor histidine kinase/response regulator n=1 Tax=Desulfobacula sp. TaxID=2593537 RepID=UPI0025BD270E|nr:PAS domain-containing hybrid sensor histidine kinase/response regulator [Desulfobacula sp.]MBC2704852.1 PAS domain S-box protein [Desulfobacula sp.]